MNNVEGLNIVIAGGGTGGHLFPGIAIADAFKDISSQNNILFMNTGNKLEKNILQKQKYNYDIIPSGGLLGKNIFQKIKSIKKIVSSLFLASKKLDEFNTDAVIGVGGYVSVPVIAAAWLKGIPVFIQEQNIIPGLSNKIFSYISKLNFTSFENTKMGPDSKNICTGNPIRKSIASNEYKITENKKITILITGGSQGAKAINKAVTDSFAFLENKDQMEFIHQTGEKDHKEIYEKYIQEKIKGEVAPFFNDMEKNYKKAKIIIARSGASTISEITCAGIPSILIPFPYATHNHQYYNSMSLVEKGAALMIEEKNLTGKILAETINNIVKSPDILLKMSSSVKTISKPNAAYDICSYIIGKLN